MPATEHDALVNGVLEDEWAATGLMLSDWFATRSTGGSANGGLDLVIPGPSEHRGGKLVVAVRSGDVPEATVREALDPEHPAHPWVLAHYDSVERWLTAAVEHGRE